MTMTPDKLASLLYTTDGAPPSESLRRAALVTAGAAYDEAEDREVNGDVASATWLCAFADAIYAAVGGDS